MEMEPGIAVITGPDDWEKATLHLWGVSLLEIRQLFHTESLDAHAVNTENVEFGERIRRIVINPPIQRVSVTF